VTEWKNSGHRFPLTEQRNTGNYSSQKPYITDTPQLHLSASYKTSPNYWSKFFLLRFIRMTVEWEADVLSLGQENCSCNRGMETRIFLAQVWCWHTERRDLSTGAEPSHFPVGPVSKNCVGVTVWNIVASRGLRCGNDFLELDTHTMDQQKILGNDQHMLKESYHNAGSGIRSYI
jgi:hypothetical protein